MLHSHLPVVTNLDRQIQALQVLLHEELSERWQLGDYGYQSYGRTYKLPVPGQRGAYRPEAYTVDGEYRDVLLDDRYTVTSFFGVGDNTTIDTSSSTVPVHIVFFVNLEKIASVPGRGDQQVRDTVQALLSPMSHGFTPTQVVTRIEAVLAEYSLNRTANQQETTLKYADMHPFHAFRINGTMRYANPQPY